jgi:N-ethylmaleimide reductase
MTPTREPLLFSEATLGNLRLKNRIAMAPMTRARATRDHVPTPIMATYYAQRASAGLLISEGTAPSKNGAGYGWIPGLYTAAHIEAWRKVTDAVHSRDGRIFVQIMHTGRISHPLNMDEGAVVLAPSPIAAAGEIFAGESGPRPYPTPKEMTTFEVEEAIAEFVGAARNAVLAGFDGVEIHGANGYLVEQFLRPTSNRRTDAYGGGIAGRAKFLLEIVRRSGEAIGFDRVGVRLSPFGTFNDMPNYPEMAEDYVYLARELSRLGIAYLHLIDHAAPGEPSPVPEDVRARLREAFRGPLISAGGYDAKSGEAALESGEAEFIAIGKPFIGNPDLVERLRTGRELNALDFKTFYGGGEAGYLDYPSLDRETECA